MSPDKLSGLPVRKRFSASEIAALFISLSLVFHGGAMLIMGNFTQAAADFTGAFGTAGLPSIWTKGLKVIFPDPVYDGFDPSKTEMQKPKTTA